MDRLREMETFVAVAEAGSFAGAAATLRLSAPSVTRVILSLEDRLGTRLITRTTRRLSLTEPGLRYLDAARRLLVEIDMAEREAAGESMAPQGHLTLTAPATFGRMTFAPIARAFLAEYPRISVSLQLLDRVTDLVNEGIDAGVRIADLPESTLVARRVGQVRRMLVASPAYLARRGAPSVPEDLGKHDCISFTGFARGRGWRFPGPGGGRHVEVMPRFEVNDAPAAIEAAIAGEGITMILSYMVAMPLRAGLLAPVLEAFAPPAVPVHLVYPQGRMIAPKLRAFLDFAAPRLSTALAGLAPD